MQTSPGIAPVEETAKPKPVVSEAALPASDGWDSAETVTSIPDDDDTTTVPRDDAAHARALPPVTESEREREKPVTSVLAATPLAPPVSLSPQKPVTAQSSAANAMAAVANAMPQGVPAAMREEVWTIVRSAVDQAVAPLGSRIKELEARVERAEKASVARVPAASSATARLASIPVTAGSSIPPALSVSPSVTFTDADASPRSQPPRGSMPATGLGIVVVPPGPRPAVDLEAIARQPVGDLEFNPGGSKRLVGRVVVGLLVLAVVAFAILTIMSHNGPR